MSVRVKPAKLADMRWPSRSPMAHFAASDPPIAPFCSCLEELAALEVD